MMREVKQPLSAGEYYVFEVEVPDSDGNKRWWGIQSGGLDYLRHIYGAYDKGKGRIAKYAIICVEEEMLPIQNAKAEE